jgi:hypothetical protein
MSLVQTPLPVPISPPEATSARKRTSSFSYSNTAFSPNPRPAKAARMTGTDTLRRHDTMLVIPEGTTNSVSASKSVGCNADATSLPYYRTLQYFKDQRLRRKALHRPNVEPIGTHTRLEVTHPQPAPCEIPQHEQPRCPPVSAAKPPPSKPRNPNVVTTKKRTPTPTAPPQVILPSVSSPITVLRTPRTSSPLSPTRTTLPGRPVFPRSKPETDLYRTAIKMCMRSSPLGQKILHMGPRLAMSIMTATQELERIVADQQERDKDNDVVMSDSTLVSPTSLAMPVLTTSWVMVKGEDWEMIDCAA